MSLNTMGYRLQFQHSVNKTDTADPSQTLNNVDKESNEIMFNLLEKLKTQ